MFVDLNEKYDYITILLKKRARDMVPMFLLNSAPLVIELKYEINDAE